MGGSSTTLSIVLKLIDDASGALKNTAANFDTSLKQLEPAFKTVAIASGAAFAAVTGEIYAATNAARVDIEIHKQLQAVLKSTGGVAGVTAQAADQLANSLQNVTNYDNDAVLSAENMLLTFTKIGKDIFPQATETVLNMASALGEDTKDAAIQLGKALQDPIIGVTALRRVGVSFTEDQVKMIKSLVDSGHQLEAQQYILKELNTEFGGSARATADPVIQLNNAIGDMQKEIGKALIPVLNDLVKKIVPVVTHIMEWVDAHPKLTAAILIGIGALSGLVALLATVSLIMVGLIPTAAALGIGVLALVGWMALIPIAIAVIIAIGYELIQHWAQIKAEAQMIWAAIAGFIAEHWQQIIQILLPGIGSLVILFADNWNAIKGGIEAVWEGIKAIIMSAVDYIEGIVQGLFDTVSGIVNRIISAVNSVSGAVSHISGASGLVGGLAAGVAHAIIPAFASGGIVTGPTIGLIGEAGPEAIIPLSQLGASNITVNITGNTISSKMDLRSIADEVGSEIVRVLRLNQRLTI